MNKRPRISPSAFHVHVVACLALGVITMSLGVSSPAVASNKLETHRESVRLQRFDTSEIQGQIVRVVDDNRLVTSLTYAQLQSQGMEDADIVTIRIGDHALRSRIYLLNADSPIAPDLTQLDRTGTDVLCIISSPDASAHMDIIGNGGGLAEWLGLQPGVPFSIHKQTYVNQ